MATRPHAATPVAIVSPDSTLREGAGASWQQTSLLRYQAFRFWNSRRLRVTLAGLGIAVAGIIIDGTLAIGAVAPAIIVTAATVVTWMWVSLILKIVGAALVFVNETLLDKD